MNDHVSFEKHEKFAVFDFPAGFVSPVRLTAPIGSCCSSDSGTQGRDPSSSRNPCSFLGSVHSGLNFGLVPLLKWKIITLLFPGATREQKSLEGKRSEGSSG